MAIYQYACMECDQDYEKERSITDPEPQYFCDKCGYALSRVYSPVSALFKGGGFYTNDSRRQLQLGSSSLAGAAGATEAPFADTTMS